MAEEGIDDFGYAKRKAARQAGAPDARALPSNEEVEQALHAYRSLCQEGEHAALLARLRQRALSLMRLLAQFNPHLTGPVLTGVAGKHSDVHLQLFADSPKEVEIFLLNRGFRFRTGEARLVVNDLEKSVPTYLLTHEGTDFRIDALGAQDIRHQLRTGPAGRPLERAPLATVEILAAA